MAGKAFAISSPWRSPAVRMNAPTPAFIKASRSRFLYLMRWSLVSTIQLLRPTWVNQSSSFALGGK